MSLLAVESLSWPREDEPLLRELQLTVALGERVAVLGSSGTGKSTLLRCLVGLEPYSGTIRFRGESIGPANILAVRGAMVLVPQTPVAVGATFDDNLAFARHSRRMDAAGQQALVDACDLANIPADRPFDRLSVGERQRLCFVRAMTLEPELLLLDEPTASLDAGNVKAIERLVAAWQAQSSDRAVVWVTHDESQAARVAERVLTLRGGRLEPQ